MSRRRKQAVFQNSNGCCILSRILCEGKDFWAGNAYSAGNVGPDGQCPSEMISAATLRTLHTMVISICGICSCFERLDGGKVGLHNFPTRTDILDQLSGPQPSEGMTKLDQTNPCT